MLNRRISAVVCSTTTSATGMPILESHPVRQRSSSLKGTSTQLNQHLSANRFFPCLSYPNEHLNGKLVMGEISLNTNNSRFTSPIIKSFKVSNTNCHFHLDETQNLSTEMKNIQNTSDYESGESPTNSDYNSDTDKLQLSVNTLTLNLLI
jgi:hypothetical protein